MSYYRTIHADYGVQRMVHCEVSAPNGDLQQIAGALHSYSARGVVTPQSLQPGWNSIVR